METSKQPAATPSSSSAIDLLSTPSNPGHWYAYASSTFLALLSFPLLLFPRAVLLLSTPSGSVGQPTLKDDVIGAQLTALERYISYQQAISMLAIACMILILSGAIPVTTSPIADSTSVSGKSPFQLPVVAITTLYFAFGAITAWSQVGDAVRQTTTEAAQAGLGSFGRILAVAHFFFAIWGFGVFLFANDMTRNPKKGGDPNAKNKSVSSYPFKNQHAEEEKAKSG